MEMGTKGRRWKKECLIRFNEVEFMCSLNKTAFNLQLRKHSGKFGWLVSWIHRPKGGFSGTSSPPTPHRHGYTGNARLASGLMERRTTKA